MTTAKPLRADARRNRAALLAKAREVFAAGDFDLRFDDFARLAGVGTGTLYRHFPTREALAEAVYREEIDAMRDRARELQTTLPPEQALTTLLRSMVSYLHTHQGLARALAAFMATHSGAVSEGSQALGETITDLMAAAAADGAIRDDVRAGAVIMALQGICTAYDHPDGQTHADDLLTLVLDGLRPDAS
ncbi:TetR/AcrR family transcriptional regulator [Natronosporangium hydrolyticum]|uniref:TetR/AcrR family transcriptional regulator n=1 Tax=Natronosporangium hydrolyticum TaxID=2811111 RepID=A0A895YCT2_9ACTN|nr:TetR/AcrR family transcriptional regulator [Natronosporangium hydrolyticum]QSB13159.1 TetR/AcrR family transcriptional regulator [Natronosporangium hydrolyticum]